ncbi:BRISC and BRCA1-A complex member 2-like [Clavelina lepadiformis]|uniref:BRISC and BRCA1-A complex member 2 n=1 Tax=Clavelina lepadiformis TaxID=159417 RepID=A0ABP0FPE8_CLALP
MELSEWGLCDWIQPLVKQVLHGPTGFCVGGLKIEDPISSAACVPHEVLKNANDIFSIAIPLAGDILRWQFIFDGSNPGSPPDILFSEYEDFDPEYDDIISLVKWDQENEENLLHVVKDVVGLYKDHHKFKCYQLGEKFKTELEELFECEGLNVEVSIKRTDRTGNQRTMNILVQFQADFTDIIEKDIPLDAVIHSPLLLIKYELNTGKVAPVLFLPSHVERVLGGRGALGAPPFTVGLTVLDYVNRTRERVNESIKTLSESHEKRCEYIAAFLSQFSGHVLEYDAEKFFKISLLFNYQTFFFIIHVSLTKLFPSEQPVITFQSAYHVTKRSQLCQSVSNNYPYSPRWPGSEMAKRAKLFILEKIPHFKETCIRSGVL